MFRTDVSHGPADSYFPPGTCNALKGPAAICVRIELQCLCVGCWIFNCVDGMSISKARYHVLELLQLVAGRGEAIRCYAITECVFEMCCHVAAIMCCWGRANTLVPIHACSNLLKRCLRGVLACNCGSMWLIVTPTLVGTPTSPPWRRPQKRKTSCRSSTTSC